MRLDSITRCVRKGVYALWRDFFLFVEPSAHAHLRNANKLGELGL